MTTCFKPNIGPFSSEDPSRHGTHLTMTHFLERQKERFLVLSWCRALCPFIFPKFQMYDSNVQVKVNILQVTSTSSFQRNERNKRMSERALTHPLCLTLWLYGLQPARLLCPWDFPGKDTGVGCHFLLQSKRVPRNKGQGQREQWENGCVRPFTAASGWIPKVSACLNY